MTGRVVSLAAHRARRLAQAARAELQGKHEAERRARSLDWLLGPVGAPFDGGDAA
jgi:hypothetical protein